MAFIGLVSGVFKFDAPMEILRTYLFQVPFPFRYIRLRSGLEFQYTGQVMDITTAIVMFVKNEYGVIQKDDIIVDIGANIGMFSIHAAQQGAKKIIAIEPNTTNYQLLIRNISQNQFQHIITPIQKAVTDSESDEVFILKEASPMSYVKKEVQEKNDFEKISTISLSEIFDTYDLDRIDVLKIDCEAAEHFFIPDWKEKDLVKIKSIKMELHPHPDGRDRYDTLSNLIQSGFRITRDADGLVWLENDAYIFR